MTYWVKCSKCGQPERNTEATLLRLRGRSGRKVLGRLCRRCMPEDLRFSILALLGMDKIDRGKK